MGFKGTKGKWKLRNEHNLIFVESPKEEIKKPYGQEILADDYFNEEERIYDALLISKAPEMLDLLIEVMETTTDKIRYEKCKQLIKEATEI